MGFPWQTLHVQAVFEGHAAILHRRHLCDRGEGLRLRKLGPSLPAQVLTPRVDDIISNAEMYRPTANLKSSSSSFDTSAHADIKSSPLAINNPSLSARSTIAWSIPFIAAQLGSLESIYNGLHFRLFYLHGAKARAASTSLKTARLSDLGSDNRLTALLVKVSNLILYCFSLRIDPHFHVPKS